MNLHINHNIPANASLDTLWDMYNMAVVELKEADKKLERAEKGYQMWLEIASASNGDDELYLNERVSTRLAKVEKLQGKVINARHSLENLRLRVTAKIRVATKVEEDLADYIDEMENVSECEGMLKAYEEFAAGLALELKQTRHAKGLDVITKAIDNLLWDVKDIEIDYPIDLVEYKYLKAKFNEIIEELIELKRKAQAKQF